MWIRVVNSEHESTQTVTLWVSVKVRPLHMWSFLAAVFRCVALFTRAGCRRGRSVASWSLVWAESHPLRCHSDSASSWFSVSEHAPTPVVVLQEHKHTPRLKLENSNCLKVDVLFGNYYSLQACNYDNMKGWRHTVSCILQAGHALTAAPLGFISSPCWSEPEQINTHDRC